MKATCNMFVMNSDYFSIYGILIFSASIWARHWSGSEILLAYNIFRMTLDPLVEANLTRLLKAFNNMLGGMPEDEEEELDLMIDQEGLIPVNGNNYLQPGTFDWAKNALQRSEEAPDFMKNLGASFILGTFIVPTPRVISPLLIQKFKNGKSLVARHYENGRFWFIILGPRTIYYFSGRFQSARKALSKCILEIEILGTKGESRPHSLKMKLTHFHAREICIQSINGLRNKMAEMDGYDHELGDL
ncbi:hypothetical protein ACJX0J_031250, partial [Zea mays]